MEYTDALYNIELCPRQIIDDKYVGIIQHIDNGIVPFGFDVMRVSKGKWNIQTHCRNNIAYR